MASLKQKIARVIGREFIAGKIYRVDMDRVDVLPVGSTGVLRSLPLTGDRDKVKPGDSVKIVTVAGQRVVLTEDLAVDEPEVQAPAPLTDVQQMALERVSSQETGGMTVGYKDAGSQLIVTDPLGNLPENEWRKLAEAAYASSLSITLPKDVAALFPKGAKLRIMQSDAYKYFYVLDAAYSDTTFLTTLTVKGDHGTYVASEAIQEFAYSHCATPSGFPDWFIFASVWTSTGTQPSVGNAVGRSFYKIEGSLLTWILFFTMGSTTTFGSGTWRFTVPAAPYSDGYTVLYFGNGKARDASSGSSYPLLVQMNAGQAYLTYFINTASPATISGLGPAAPFTWAASDDLGWQIQYRI